METRDIVRLAVYVVLVLIVMAFIDSTVPPNYNGPFDPPPPF